MARQQQQQKQRPQKATRTMGELVIATLDVLLSLPLVFILVKVFPVRSPQQMTNWLPFGLLFSIALGLLSAGLLLGVRQHKRARLCQWLAALGAIALTTLRVIQIWPELTTLWITCILYALVALVLSTLALLLHRLKED